MNRAQLIACVHGAASAALLFLCGLHTSLSAPTPYLSRLPEDEIVYFLLPDRFENGTADNDAGHLSGDRLKTGFDPTNKGFFHGGDLAGVVKRLDYIQALGATAIWLTPVLTNQAVQGPPGRESAGYHGYWITDFTHVDPHLGDDNEYRALVQAAHARGLKVYFDIVVNHTADVIAYRDCTIAPCLYRSRAEYPFQRRGGVSGERINSGFLGDDAAHQTPENFAHLRRSDYAYVPYVPQGKEHLKAPEWLNDPIYYHNRGESTFSGESSSSGDFFGLDDIMTEHPRVVKGFIEVYGNWIAQFKVDGFRIDTAKHVNPEFFQAFVPAMLARAAAQGNPHFHIFGEVYSTDPAVLASHTHTAKLPAVLDFSFAKTVRDVCLGSAGTDALAALFADDVLYAGGEAAARRLPTFISNHDQGRFGYFMLHDAPAMPDEEALQRSMLANAMLFTLRGVPVIYYGDEQGFAGSDGDMDARQDMFASQVASYQSERVLGGAPSAGADHFNRAHPLFLATQSLARLRTTQPALRRGRQIVRLAGGKPGIFAVSRIDPVNGQEIVVAFNSSTLPATARVQVNGDAHFRALAGHCEDSSTAGSYEVSLAPLAYAVCAARPQPSSAP